MRISDWSSDVCSSDLLEGREAGGAAFALPPPAYCRAVLGRTTVLHLAVLMAAKGAAQGSGLWINGETLTQRANTETNVRLYLGIASYAFLPQRVEHVSDPVADLLKIGRPT